MKIAVIADDLTGAADAGVQLARAGHRTAVAFRGERVDADAVPSGRPSDPGGATMAVVMDTDSRGLAADEAAARVRACPLGGFEIVMKKIDSTLRGPVAAEVDAALEASGRGHAVLAPAFPRAGRTTVGGVQLVEGEPVHRTRFARDPVSPVREADLRRLLPDADVRDAGTDEDLEAIVRSVKDPSSVLWVGSAGLAAALGAVYPGDGAAAGDEGRGGPVLTVVGSTNETAREQIARMDAPVVVMPLDGRDVSARVTDALAWNGVCVLHPAAGAGDPRRIAVALAENTARVTEQTALAGLVLTGGDTAVHVARRLGATGLRVEDELEPGVVLGRLVGPRPYRTVTKAGGFGSPDALRRASAALAAAGSSRA
jgi:uncharacterized protein YgbK (DUF1537 family)